MMEQFEALNQTFNEKRYSRHHIDGYIKEELLANGEVCRRMDMGVTMLNDWMRGTYYESKMKRLAQLQDVDLEPLVLDIMIGIAYYQREELFTSVTAQLAGRLRWDDKTDAITTMAEIVAVLCRTDLFDINKASRSASLMVVSRMPLSVKLLDHIEQSQYLPPMVCAPKKLTNNYCSAYLGHKDSLILKNNHHDGDICLDVLNRMNAVPLKLAIDQLCGVEEERNSDIKTREEYNEWVVEKNLRGRYPYYEAYVQDAKDQWMQFKKQSYRFYELLNSQGNKFYLTNKVDKRGRIYSQGYHINVQGTAFKKSIVELYDEEIVEGVPDVYRI